MNGRPRITLLPLAAMVSLLACSGGGASVGSALGAALSAGIEDAKKSSKDKGPSEEDWDRDCRERVADLDRHLDAELDTVVGLPATRDEQADVMLAAWDHLAGDVRDAVPRECKAERRREHWDQLEARLAHDEVEVRLLIVGKLVESDAPAPARERFRPLYEAGRDQRDERYGRLAEALAERWDDWQLLRFQAEGAYGAYGGPAERFGCVFAPSAFPEDMSRIGAVFTSHLAGHHVDAWCLLPAEAQQYEAGVDARLVIQLVGADEAVLATRTIGQPGRLGATRAVAASFGLPAEADAAMSRAWYTVRVAVTRSFPDADGQLVPSTQHLSESDFTWHAP